MVFIFWISVNKIWYELQENPVDSLLKKIRKETLTFQPVTVFCPLNLSVPKCPTFCRIFIVIIFLEEINESPRKPTLYGFEPCSFRI